MGPSVGSTVGASTSEAPIALMSPSVVGVRDVGAWLGWVVGSVARDSDNEASRSPTMTGFLEGNPAGDSDGGCVGEYVLCDSEGG